MFEIFSETFDSSAKKISAQLPSKIRFQTFFWSKAKEEEFSSHQKFNDILIFEKPIESVSNRTTRYDFKLITLAHR